MSKDEIRNLLQNNKPNAAVKTFRKDVIPHLLKFMEDNDQNLQKNAIVAFGIAGKRIGVSKKDVESFIKNLDRLSPNFHEEIATAISDTGDVAILQLIGLLSDKKIKTEKKEMIFSLFSTIGDKKVIEALLGEKITNPSEATYHEFLLRTQTSLLENSEITTYDPNIDYTAQLSDFKKLLSHMFSSKDEDDVLRALDACAHFPTIATEFSGTVASVIEKGKTQELQIRALETLGELRNPASIGILRKQLDEINPTEIRIAATTAMGTIGHESGVEPIIKHVLNTQDEFLRQAAVNALGKIGEPAAEELVNLLSNELFKDQVEIALKRIGEPAVKHLRRAMANNNKVIRKNASDLAKLILTTKYGVGGTVLRLIELLSDRDQTVREQVIETIVNMGDPGLENVIRSFVSHDKNIRENSIEILNKFAFMNIQLVVEDAIKKNLISGAELLFLLGIFCDDDEILDYVFKKLDELHEMEDFSNAVKQAILDNIFLYNDLFLEQDEGLKFNMAQICGYLGKPAIENVSNYLSDRNDEVKEVALNSLSFIGPDAHVAINLIRPFAKDKNIALRKAAIKSLGAIADSSGVPEILEALGDDDEEIQTVAQEAIDKIGVTNIPMLIDLLGTTGSNDRLLNYIANLDYSSLRAAIIDRLTNDDKNFQEAVLKLVVKVSNKYPEFKDYLLTEVRLSPNENVHILGVRSFGALKFEPALPLLIDELLKDNKKLNQACMDSIYLGFGEQFVETCIREMEKGGSEISAACSNFLKSVDPNFTVVPLIASLATAQGSKPVIVDLLKKIGDKNISAKLSSVDDANQYKKLMMAEPDLAKVVDKLTV